MQNRDSIDGKNILEQRRKEYLSEFVSRFAIVLSALSSILTILSAIGTNYLLTLALAYQKKAPYLFDSNQNRLIGVFVVATIGISFYVLRQRQRVAYAILEFGAGLGLCYYAATKMADDHRPDAAIAAILGCIYIIVRACDNFNQGEKGQLGFLVTGARRIWHRMFN